MTADPGEIINGARGQIDRKLLTETGAGGYFGSGYLAERPAISYLDDDEQLQFLLDNDNKGLQIAELETPEETTSLEVTREHTKSQDSAYRAFALVTSQRILFLLGAANGDNVVEVPLEKVLHTEGESGILKNKFVVKDDAKRYVFQTKKDTVTDAAAYVSDRVASLRAQQRTVPNDGNAEPDGTPEQAQGMTTASSDSNTTSQVRSTRSDKTGRSNQKDGNATEDEQPSTVEKGDNSDDEATTEPVTTEATALREDSDPQIVSEYLEDVSLESAETGGLAAIEADIDRLVRTHTNFAETLATKEEGDDIESLEADLSQLETTLKCLNYVQTAIETAEDYLEKPASDENRPTPEEAIDALNQALSELEGTPIDESRLVEIRRSIEVDSTETTLDSTDVSDGKESKSRERARCLDEEYSQSPNIERDGGSTDDTTDLASLSIDVSHIVTSTTGDSVAEFLSDAASELDNFDSTVESFDHAISSLMTAHAFLSNAVSTADETQIAEEPVEQLLAEIEAGIDGLEELKEKRRQVRETLPHDVERWLDCPEEDDLPQTTHDPSEVISELESIKTQVDELGVTIRSIDRDIKRLQEIVDKDGKTDCQEELLDNLRAVADKLGRVPDYSDMGEHGEFDAKAYSYEFESWNAAVEAAGFDMRDQLIEDLQAVVDQLGYLPTMPEVEELGKYRQGRYNDYFDSWEDALSAAEVSYPTKEELESELVRLEEELGRVPMASDIDQHAKYPPRLYRLQFGSVRQAIDTLGFSYREDILEEIREVARELERVPRVNDFGEHSAYNNGIVYNEFAGWTTALEEAGVADPADVSALLDEEDPDSDSSAEESEIQPNPLAEHYEGFRMVRVVQEALFNGPPSQSLDADAPTARWYELIETWVNGDGPIDDAECYGAQQRDRNEISMRDYRAEFGNGDVILDFQSLDPQPLPQSLQHLLAAVDADLDVDSTNLAIPVSPDSNEPLPIIVETDKQLTRARRLIDEFPAKPETAEPTDSFTEGSSSRTAASLTEIGGVTEDIAKILGEHGIDSPEALAEASIESLTEISGIPEVKAARIMAAVSQHQDDGETEQPEDKPQNRGDIGEYDGIRDAVKSVLCKGSYSGPEEVLQESPSRDTITLWTDTLTGFEANTSISPEAADHLNELEKLYEQSNASLENHATEIGVKYLNEFSPSDVLFMVCIRELQKQYTGKANLNPHKFGVLQADRYSVD